MRPCYRGDVRRWLMLVLLAGCDIVLGLKESKDASIVVAVDGNPNLDSDSDTVMDDKDNCITVANTDQHDEDLDGDGDRCDNCPHEPNPAQDNEDADELGDACDINDQRQCIVHFDPFTTAPTPTGETSGTWVGVADAWKQDAEDNLAAAIVVDPTPRTRPLAIVGVRPLRISAIQNDHTLGLWCAESTLVQGVPNDGLLAQVSTFTPMDSRAGVQGAKFAGGVPNGNTGVQLLNPQQLLTPNAQVRVTADVQATRMRVTGVMNNSYNFVDLATTANGACRVALRTSLIAAVFEYVLVAEPCP